MPSVLSYAQQRLQDSWLAAAPGSLCAWEQAKALAFREASKELHGGKVKLAWVASKLTKQGGGTPQKGSLSEFFAKVDADPEWFPGKHRGGKRGRPPVLTTAKRRCFQVIKGIDARLKSDKLCMLLPTVGPAAAAGQANHEQPGLGFIRTKPVLSVLSG